MSLQEDIEKLGILNYFCREFIVLYINGFSRRMYLKNGGELNNRTMPKTLSSLNNLIIVF
jgi:hypothetical protein